MLKGLSVHMPSRLASQMHSKSISFSPRKCWRKSSLVDSAPLIFKEATHSLSFTGFFFCCEDLSEIFDSIGGETVVGAAGLMADDLVGGLTGLDENFVVDAGAGGAGMVGADAGLVGADDSGTGVVGADEVDAGVAGADGVGTVDAGVVGAGDVDVEVVGVEDVEAVLVVVVGEMMEVVG